MKQKTIYALGFFDGVHQGHAALLKVCRALAQETGANAGVLTFSVHPDTFVSGKAPALINAPADRKKLLTEQFHMDTVLELPFDKAMMQMPWQDFFRMLTTTLHAGGLVCGEDFRFGYKGQGNAALLQQECTKAGIPCAVIPEQTMDGITVSSTYIRDLLEQGEMEQAVRFLGHPHILTGTVISGHQIGRTLGIPTANLLIPQGVVQPKAGVYACKACVQGQEYLAVTNIGSRPTVGGHTVTVESWLLDFDGDLYGQTLTLSFYAWLREEKKFPSLEALKEEIQKNAGQTRKLLQKI